MRTLLVAAGVVAVLVAVLVAAYWTLIYANQRSMLFPAPPLSGAPPRPADARQLWLESPATRTEAWFLPPTVRRAGKAPLVIFSHGNGELIDHWPWAFDEPRAWGVGVLLVEYPGYGRSPGQPSEVSIRQTLRAAFSWALAQPDVDAARIVLYGRSLGGSAAAGLAQESNPAALVLESAFTSTRAFARHLGAPAALARDPLDALSAVRSYRGPILVLHGDRDDIVPTDHGRALAAASSRATLHLLPCGHNDCPRPWALVRAFLEKNAIIQP